MISPLGDSVKEFGALSWSYEITFKSNSRELRFEEARFDKLEYFLIFKQRHVTLYTLHILHFTYISVLHWETPPLLAIVLRLSSRQYLYSYVGSYSNR